MTYSNTNSALFCRLRLPSCELLSALSSLRNSNTCSSRLTQARARESKAVSVWNWLGVNSLYRDAEFEPTWREYRRSR